MGRTMWLEVKNKVIDEFVESHSIKLTTKKLLHIQREEQKNLAEKMLFEKKEERGYVMGSLIKEMCVKWGEV